MRNFITVILLSMLLGSSTAAAKIQFGGVDAEDVHVQTVRGFLYEALHSVPSGIRDFWKPHFIQAVLWFERAHKEEDKTYKVESFGKNDNEILIKAAFDSINSVVVKRDDVAELSLRRWHKLGSKVTVAIDKNKKTGKTTWHFDILSE